jgi:hypothetical protein
MLKNIAILRKISGTISIPASRQYKNTTPTYIQQKLVGRSFRPLLLT